MSYEQFALFFLFFWFLFWEIGLKGAWFHISYRVINNNYFMSPSWIWSDKITNERVARVGYNHFISNKGTWNNCFSKFSNRVLPPIFISTILKSVRKEDLARYFPYDVKLGLLAHSRSFLANQKARNAIVGAENLLNHDGLAYENSWIALSTDPVFITTIYKHPRVMGI